MTCTLVKILKTYVRPCADYCLLTYGSAAKSRLKEIDVELRKVLRFILGCMAATRIVDIYAEAGLMDLQTRREWLTTRYAARITSLQNYPLHEAFVREFNKPSVLRPHAIPGIAIVAAECARLDPDLCKDSKSWSHRVYTPRPWA